MLVAVTPLVASTAGVGGPYGACAHLTHGEFPYSRATMAKMRALGMGWLRTDFTTAMIRPTSNSWDYSRWDKVMDDAQAEGIAVLPMFGYHAEWATPAWDHLDSYVDFVTNAMRRYNGRFSVVEIWNEVDGRWNARHDGEQMAKAAADYVRLLSASYRAVKAFDPSVKVAISGFAGVHPEKMRAVYRAGAKDWFDIMNIHPYTNPRPPEGELERLLAETRNVMAEFGDSAKPIWITELGWTTPEASLPTPGIIAASLAELAEEGFATKRIACVDVFPSNMGERMFSSLCNEFRRNPGTEVMLVPASRLAAELSAGNFDVVAFPPDESYASDSFPAVVDFVKGGGIVVIVGGMPFAYRMVPDGKGGYVREPGTNGKADAAKLRVLTRSHHDGSAFPPYGRFRPEDIRLEAARPKGRFAGGSIRWLRRDLLKDGDRLVPMMSRMNGTDELICVGTYRYGDMKGAVVIDGTATPNIGSTVTEADQASYTVRGNLIAAFSGIEKTFVYEFASTEREPHYGESHFGIHRLDLREKPAAHAYRTMTRMRPAGSVNESGAWQRDGFYFPAWRRPDGRRAGALWSVGNEKVHRLSAAREAVSFFNLDGETVEMPYADGAFAVALSDSPVYWIENGQDARPAIGPVAQPTDDDGAGETQAWQSKIDEAAREGGGQVTVPAGRHLVGQLDLRSNVTLHLERGAVLEGLVGLEHYRVTTLPYSEGTWSAIVSAIGVTNVAITGEGEIFGNGSAWKIPEDYGGNQEGLRARGVFFADSENIRLSGFTLRDAACWSVVLKCCRHVRIEGVTVDSHANSNNDGFDIEVSDVLVENCHVDAGDDAYCIKSNNPDFTVENVTVRNCRARSHSNGCKIGTATHGTIRNVLFDTIVCEAPTRDFTDNRLGSINFGKPHFYRPELLHLPAGGGLGAIAIECVDGGCVEKVTARNFKVSGFIAPIFVRAGTRKGRDCGTPPGTQYLFRDILIENVCGRSETPVASSISGVDGCHVRNVTLKNIDIECPGTDEVASQQAMEMPVPDVSECYPECTMFSPSILPAFGLYVDRVDGFSSENVVFRLRDGSKDARPPVFLSDKILRDGHLP